MSFQRLYERSYSVPSTVTLTAEPSSCTAPVPVVTLSVNSAAMENAVAAVRERIYHRYEPRCSALRLCRTDPCSLPAVPETVPMALGDSWSADP